jgi:hypothetical protein
MLQSIKKLYGDNLGAAEGEIGHVKDFYFDDKNWAVRYVVVDTGTWLPGRQVLLSPHAFGSIHQSGKLLLVKLTRKQIENSPSLESHKPVDRSYETEYYKYYGWPYYWEGSALWGDSGVPISELPVRPFPRGSAIAEQRHDQPSEQLLRSTQAVDGFLLKTSDGMTGHVCDFLMDPHNWAIQQLVIKTGHRLSGKEVQIPITAVERIDYDKSIVVVTMTSEAVEHSPESESALVGVAA